MDQKLVESFDRLWEKKTLGDFCSSNDASEILFPHLDFRLLRKVRNLGLMVQTVNLRRPLLANCALA